VVGCESGIYIAPVESNGAFLSLSLLSLLMDKKYSDGISVDIELYAPYFASGNDNDWAQNV
jgi:hypothetical protein